jgi:hypothetical protein
VVNRILVIKDEALDGLHGEILYHRLNTSEKFASTMKIDFMQRVDSILPNPYIYPECRFLPTKTQIYRNIVWGNYLIIYRVKKEIVEVLGVFHTKQKPAKIKLVKKKQ